MVPDATVKLDPDPMASEVYTALENTPLPPVSSVTEVTAPPLTTIVAVGNTVGALPV